jgi:hypothetical protein
MALLATQEDLVMLGRVCIPEIPAMFLEAVVFVTVLRAQGQLGGILFAGFVMGLCLGMKATTAPILIVFGAVVWMNGDPEIGSRARRLVAFYVPILLGGATASTILAVFFDGVNLLRLQSSVDVRAMLGGFVGVNDVYTVMRFPFASPLAPTMNLWSLAVWVGLLSTLSSPHKMEKSVRRWKVASAIWAMSYLALGALASYFPERYLAHILVPLAILATLSIHSFLQVGVNGVAQNVRRLGPGRRLSFFLCLALPAAVLLAPGVLWLLGILSPDLRLRWKILAFSVIWSTLTAFLYRREEGWTASAIAFSVAAFAMWFAGHQLLDWNFWTVTRGFDALLQWAVVFGAATAIGALAALRKERSWPSGPILVGGAAAYMAISAAPYLVALLWPSFTIRDASRDLAVLLQDQTQIASHEAEGLFVDNELRYESHYRLSWRDSPPQIVVSFELPGREIKFPIENYRPRKTYPLYVSPRYSEGPARVIVYDLFHRDEKSLESGH